MAKIKLTGGFKKIPEGTYVFKITKVEYKEDFGKMKVTLETKDKQRLTEQYSLLKSDGEVNEGAMNAFSALAEAALDVPRDTEIDEQDLVGCYLRSNVVWQEDAKGNTYSHLGYEKEHVDGWDDSDADDEEEEEAPVKKQKKSLDDILNS